MTDRPLILPPLRRTAQDAMAFAKIVHKGQTDKAGRPYVQHLLGVASSVALLYGGGDEAGQVAWLHDTVEDKRCTAVDLLREGFSAVVVRDVVALDRASFDPDDGPHPSYLDWIKHLAATGSQAVILVKIADIEDNSDPERLALLDEPTRERLKKKYGAALPILKHAAARMGWRQGHG